MSDDSDNASGTDGDERRRCGMARKQKRDDNSSETVAQMVQMARALTLSSNEALCEGNRRSTEAATVAAKIQLLQALAKPFLVTLALATLGNISTARLPSSPPLRGYKTTPRKALCKQNQRWYLC
jgi:hypothetical protein